VTLQHSGGSCLRPGVDRVLSYSNASEKPWHSAALSGTQRHWVNSERHFWTGPDPDLRGHRFCNGLRL